MANVEYFPIEVPKKERIGGAWRQHYRQRMHDAEGNEIEFFTNASRPKLPDALTNPREFTRFNAYHKFQVLQTLGFVALPDIPALDIYGNEISRLMPVFTDLRTTHLRELNSIDDAIDKLAGVNMGYTLLGDQEPPTELINPADMLDLVQTGIASVRATVTV